MSFFIEYILRAANATSAIYAVSEKNVPKAQTNVPKPQLNVPKSEMNVPKA